MSKITSYMTTERVFQGDLLIVNPEQHVSLARDMGFTIKSPEIKDALVALESADSGDYCQTVRLEDCGSLMWEIQQ